MQLPNPYFTAPAPPPAPMASASVQAQRSPVAVSDIGDECLLAHFIANGPMMLKQSAAGTPQTLKDISLTDVHAFISGVLKHPECYQVFAGVETLGQFVRTLADAPPKVRAIAARMLSFRATMFLPCISSEDSSIRANNRKRTAEAVLVKYISETCQFYGVEFKGDIFQVSFEILEKFGGSLSMFDLLFFFGKVRSGQYKGDTQHINTRGINAEFIFNWMAAYVAEKNEAVEQSLQAIKHENQAIEVAANVGQKAAELLANMKRENTRRALLNEQVKQRRNAFFESLFTDNFYQFYPAPLSWNQLDIEQELSPNPDIKEQIIRKFYHSNEALKKDLSRLLFEFVCFSAEKVEDFFKQSASFENEGKMLAYYVYTIRMMLKEFNRLPDVDFIIFASGSRDRKVCNQINGELQQMYYKEYLPGILKREKYPPLTLDEYRIQYGMSLMAVHRNEKTPIVESIEKVARSLFEEMQKDKKQ